MRNSCKAGGTAKKKYRIGGGTTDPPTKKVRMSPAKIAVGPVKPPTAKEKEEAWKKFKAAMEKEVGKAPFPAVPKKKIGGPIPEDPNIYRMFKKGIFGKYKIKDISKEKFDRINDRLSRDTDNTKYGTSSSPREGISKEGIGQREISVGRVSKQLIKANQEKANRAAQENVKIANEAARAELKKQYEDSLRKSKPTIMKRSGGSTKKKYEVGGGVIPSKPVMTAPMQGRLGNRPVAGGNMAKGGSLKPVNPSANPGLAKLPTAVRNKMGYAKKGGAKKK